jgi:Protein of unknown function (DUF3040)
VPLSEEELRLLDQMERALVEEDPKFVSTLRGHTLAQFAQRRAILGGVCFLIGIAILMTGAVLRITPLGIAGFVVMLVSATMGLAAWKGRPTPVEARSGGDTGLTVIEGGRRPGRSAKGKGPATSGSFMQRMEERWRRRRDQNEGGF